MIALLLLTLSGSLDTAPLRTDLENLTRGFDGRVGICVQDQRSTVCLRAEERFSIQSVMKLIVGAAVMDAIDHRGWHLEDPIVVHKSDLSLSVQPIAEFVTDQGYHTTVAELVRRAIVDSDSAAVDVLMAKLGGAAQVQAFLNRSHITGLRIDRDEKHLQTEVAGVTWQPEFVDPAKLEQATRRVSEQAKATAYRQYQKDPRDTATPTGMASFLTALSTGKLLSPASTTHLLNVMRTTATGPDRLKAGLSEGWSLAHKTGTSSSWQGIAAATNDVGIMTAPDGGRITIVVFVGDSRETPAKRAAIIASAARLVIAHYR